MSTCTIIISYWVIAVLAIYANRMYNRKKNHHMSIVEWKIVGMKDSAWRKIAFHAFTIFIEPLLLPIGIPAFLIHRVKAEKKEKERNKKTHELVVRIESDLTQDLYYKASVALVNALAHGKYSNFEKLLSDDVQIDQEGHEIIKGKGAAMKYWRSWKTEHVDSIDLDAFDRIFDDTDFEVVKSDEDSHAYIKLMMTWDAVKFEIKDGQVSKMVLTQIIKEPEYNCRLNPDTELHEWPY